MLDAAGRLFAAQRFHQVRMEDIAAEAGVGKGTIYRYFQDKEELYLALLRRASEQLLARLHEHLARADGSRQRLEAIVAAILSYFCEHPHLFDLIQRAEVVHGPDFPWQQTRREAVGMMIRLFEEAKRKGEFAVADPELAALLLLGGVRAVIRFYKKPRSRDLARRIVDTFLAGQDVLGSAAS
jgi:AcrR family transcriptional regulator